MFAVVDEVFRVQLERCLEIIKQSVPLSIIQASEASYYLDKRGRSPLPRSGLAQGA